jgi:hypothetical protein
MSERAERELLERLVEQGEEALDLLRALVNSLPQPLPVPQLKSQVIIFGASPESLVQ